MSQTKEQKKEQIKREIRENWKQSVHSSSASSPVYISEPVTLVQKFNHALDQNSSRRFLKLILILSITANIGIYFILILNHFLGQ